MSNLRNHHSTAANKRVNAPGRTVTGLAKSARPAPAQPARYAQRWADRKTREGKGLRVTVVRPGSATSTMLSPAASLGWAFNPRFGGVISNGTSRWARASRAVGMQHSGPDCTCWVRSAGAYSNEGGLLSHLLEHPLGDKGRRIEPASTGAVEWGGQLPQPPKVVTRDGQRGAQAASTPTTPFSGRRARAS